MFSFTVKVFNFAVAILNLVPPTRIELVMTGYQPIVIPFNYRGKTMAPRRGIEPLYPTRQAGIITTI